MDLKLVRKDQFETGIFSELYDASGNLLFKTLEHAYFKLYENSKIEWQPKIPAGVYTCKRGSHKLHNMVESFETFEITGVEGHKNLLFHWGNYNKDSEGCILLGKDRIQNMVTSSHLAFSDFMQLQQGLNQFQLEVV